MRVWIDLSECGRRKLVETAPTRALFAGACPLCGEDPLPVQGHGQHIEDHDTYAACGHCAVCTERVGVIRARVSTIFGLAEDERVLNGRPRVYR